MNLGRSLITESIPYRLSLGGKYFFVDRLACFGYTLRTVVLTGENYLMTYLPRNVVIE